MSWLAELAVVRGRWLKAGALQARVVAHSAKGLIIEHTSGGPALEVDTSGDTCRTAHDDLRSSSANLQAYLSALTGRAIFGHKTVTALGLVPRAS